MLEEIFKKIGLSEKMAKVYGVILEFGSQTVQQIAQKVGIPRPTAYVHIEFLIKKGLISKIKKNNRVYFIAESPENLKQLIEENLKEAATASLEFKKSIPRLGILFEAAEEKPRIRSFEGKEGLLNMIKDFKTSKFDSAEEFVSMDKAFETVPPGDNDFRQKITKKFKKIPMRIIYTSKKGPFLKDKEGSKERRFIPLEKFPYSGSITIYGNKVALMAKNKHLVGTIIENHEIANTIRTLFNFTWEFLGSKKK